MSDRTRRLVERYWELMNSNDFRAVGVLLHDEFVLDYPQSNERIRGRENNARLNEDYPSAGPWHFGVDRLLISGDQAVSEVQVHGAEADMRVISFFEIRDELIWHMTEYWADPFEAPTSRAQLVEPIS